MPDIRMDTKKLSQLYNEMLQPLTLFPATVHSADHKKGLYFKTMKKQKYEYFSGMLTTPLCELVKKRLDKRSALNIGSTAVQKIFEDIILSEVKVISESIPQVLSSSLLNPSEKQQLHRRLISHILIVSEQLLVFYLEKIERNKAQSVFSEEANITRFKAQLLLDCSRFFNVFSVRHCLIAEIKGMKGKELTHSESEDILEDRTFEIPGHAYRKSTSTGSQSSHFTMGYFIKLGRPKLAIPKCQRDIDLLQIGNIQQLDLNKAQMLMPTKAIESKITKNIHFTDEAVTTTCCATEDQKPEERSAGNKQIVLKKSASSPDLRIGELLADELHINFQIYASECPEIQHRVETHISEGDIISEDLKRLVKDSSLQKSYQETDYSYEEEIPPLISAITHGVADKSRHHTMEALLQDPDPNEQHVQTQKTEADLHPQADFVDVKIPKKPLMRRADVQTSDRIYTDFTEMPIYPPVYNDFSNEVEAASVFRMDTNLYIGQELQEVYKELTRNIPSDHLKFDQDAVIEPYATKVDFSKCISSSTLTRKKNQRVINKELDSLALSDELDSREQPVPFDKEASRICKSWLHWKSIANSEDYMNYLSTQDLDFLKVIYHLYNSDSEDEEAMNTALRKKKEERKRERDKKIAELRAEKQNYTPGMWNINSVMLGGLGIDPDLPDTEHDIQETLEFQKRTSVSQELLQKRINAVWNTLHVPEGMRLDMAIKYSSTEYQDLLPEAIEMWEQAVKHIQKREQILAKLEMFERTASDPNRFFQRGHDGTSIARINESTIRRKFHTQLTKIEQEIPKVLQVIKKKFNDTVTFEGRPYAEKMQRDKVEMLYWLQQDRRKDLMERHFKKENAMLKLEPLS
ncbi:coiled-coil domain-containing protein 87 [Spea bombifrons]|uniref:coiled-coil domain-containing protein 87 n=1 Tax=Spea bombifrons TaxID=233779 RepID=UPI00234B0EF7|nr:coiled-coil domain-containing protein 87 [Spea bombifrons]